jgi:hypothetical protein
MYFIPFLIFSLLNFNVNINNAAGDNLDVYFVRCVVYIYIQVVYLNFNTSLTFINYKQEKENFRYVTVDLFYTYRMSGSKVYVGRLASDTREKDVERFFKGYGRLRDVSMKNGYGFVVKNRFYITLRLI